ncbi:hypothetical protein Hden_1188 [Hyphomicrobium denitrificans ATCC 51888]|uniref:Uncharacterized protein n=1 Tax=Hyphomicrobium denitrificans (strain ATCC 51888 / DSM 1869 / NCIMB 11706 / TK 0415) TaxID=582899 RepID=D8JVW2_HYPDA|nr:hypothetical protein [Hyphomicrobium denitrificans]ADJ23001.1 hypothetical protein Hden_1188 [Hyphomicrobium denitrificans ATCC 51888]
MSFHGANDDQPLYRPLRFRVLSQEEKLAFNNMAPGAIWLAGPLRGAIPRGWGDNRGGWPIKISCTAYWGMRKDEKLEGRDALPWDDMDFIGRWWFDSYDMADRVRCDLLNELMRREIYEDAKGAWLSFDPDFGLDLIDAEIRRISISKKYEVLTDRELLRSLTWQLELARKVSETMGLT